MFYRISNLSIIINAYDRADDLSLTNIGVFGWI
jgi:hypothetical protein